MKRRTVLLTTGLLAATSLGTLWTPALGAPTSPDTTAAAPTGPQAVGPVVAFPGAVGVGAVASGGRGGSVHHVTNLNDSGPGSFRDAVGTGNRIVVFDVGGYIRLSSTVLVKSNITIAGQTAPGGGIGVMGGEVSFNSATNVIVRDFRFRQGDLDPNDENNGLNWLDASNMIFDHVSVEFAQYINNVVYNYQAAYTAGNSSGHFLHDVVGNYFITGPRTTNSSNAYYQMRNQEVYNSGNVIDSNRDGQLNGGTLNVGAGGTAMATPWSGTTAGIPTLPAADAYAEVLARAGAQPRDRVDDLVLADVASLGTAGDLWASQTATGLDNSGYGTIPGGTAPTDTDRDGMPNAWETRYGLDPNSGADASGDFDRTGYTNIEKYVNGLLDGSYRA
ncbi:hypothetical protein [Plantactinospora sp. KLBMP9567]|uniref:hypothetical protein n=1 Tax=Plantactinospora sp. KLBMP9567 TaxID=3085900 RepID=UPI002980B334|nr:hypothetical protein [Plantactinospora sp. KLBMP9567]MDW5324301.1 hypothetical protein [Plantactinospora sp. KLBMP9567]